MFSKAVLGIALAVMIQAATLSGPDRDKADLAQDAEIDAMEPIDGESLPVADRRLYTGRDVCAVLRAAYPVLGLSREGGQPRTGEWHRIPFSQDGFRIFGHWGSCVQKWRQFFPQVQELLITNDGRQALVSGGNIKGGECRFVRIRASWRKVICFNTWIE